MRGLSISLATVYGMVVGITFADAEDKEMFGIEWGMTLYLGPIVFVFSI